MQANSRTLRIPLDQVRTRYETGENLKDIAAAAGVSYQTIGRRLQEMGVPLRGRRMTEAARRKLSGLKRLDLPEDVIRILHLQEMSCREMASILGCHDETVRKRLIELGLPRLPAKARPKMNYFWRGGYTVDADGYILQKTRDHPEMDRHGYVRQHRLVMEKVLLRYLRSEEVVDHRNGDTSDNRPENLRLFASNAEHLRATLTGKKKLAGAERERLRQEAVLRAWQRVAAILAESGSDAGR